MPELMKICQFWPKKTLSTMTGQSFSAIRAYNPFNFMIKFILLSSTSYAFVGLTTVRNTVLLQTHLALEAAGCSVLVHSLLK